MRMLKNSFPYKFYAVNNSCNGTESLGMIQYKYHTKALFGKKGAVDV